MNSRVKRIKSLISPYFGDENSRRLISSTGEIDFSQLPITRSASHSGCSNCGLKDKDYRRDLPIWTGSIRRSIPVMIIAQDAGKKPLRQDFQRWGRSANRKNRTVFSLDILASKGRISHCDAHPFSSRILKFFEFILGDDFLDKCYFTDVVKCAFSTEKQNSISRCRCKNSIENEIELIRPRIIILYGATARDSFREIFTTRYREERLPNVAYPPNVKFYRISKYVMVENGPVAFYVPQVTGNLHGKFVDRELLREQIDNYLRG